MTTKLTLSIEKRVIEQSKIYAQKTGRSLSEIIEVYLESLIFENPENPKDISPKLRNLIGSVKLPKDFNEEKVKRTYLEDKHL